MKTKLVTILIGLFAVTSGFAQSGTTVWALENGTLTISGTGAMTDYDEFDNPAPWYSVRENIQTVVIADDITHIGACAFYECTELTSVSFGNTVNSIGKDAFYACTHLNVFVIPNTVSYIGEKAFAWSGLTYIVIPNSVTVIDYYAFVGCSGLKDVFVYWNSPSEVALSPTYGENVFEEVNTSAVNLHVPEGTKAAYQTADVWKDFSIVEGGDLTNIPLLSNLTVNKGKLSPNFSQFCFSYTISVFQNVENITLTATPLDENATVEGAGTKTLNTGENNFEIIVTTPDGTTRQTYRVKVIRLVGDYMIKWDGFTNLYTLAQITVRYNGETLKFPADVITGRYLYYTLTTDNFSGNLPLHFDLGNGKTYDRVISVSPYSIYTLKLTVALNTENSMIVTVNMDPYGRPGSISLEYRYDPCVFTVSEGNNLILTTNATLPGTLTAINGLDVTFEGNTTSIKTIEKQKMAVYPNPATDRITVSCAIGDKITLFNAQGVLLKQQTALSTAEILDIQQYAAGLYYIRVNESAAKIIKK